VAWHIGVAYGEHGSWVSNLKLVQRSYVVASGYNLLAKVLSRWIHVANPLYTQCVANLIRLKGDCCFLFVKNVVEKCSGIGSMFK